MRTLICYWSMRRNIVKEGGLYDLSLFYVTRSNQRFWLSDAPSIDSIYWLDKILSVACEQWFDPDGAVPVPGLRAVNVVGNYQVILFFITHTSHVFWILLLLARSWELKRPTMKIHIKLGYMTTMRLEGWYRLTTVRQHGGVKKIESIPLSELRCTEFTLHSRLDTLQRRHTMAEF